MGAAVIRNAAELEQTLLETLLAASVIFARDLNDLLFALLPAIDHKGAYRTHTAHCKARFHVRNPRNADVTSSSACLTRALRAACCPCTP
jgi:hypothetical protein